jgi:TetR/AcrR family transcriptional repressor of nem operon
MPRDGELTRSRILDVATELILERGFSGTTIDDVIARAGLTKGAFFYHFDSKDALARAAIDRFAAADHAHLEAALAAAEAASADPYEQVLHLVRAFESEFAKLTKPHPGCLFASYVYEAQLFDAATVEVAARASREWRVRLGAKFREAFRRRPPAVDVDPESLADAFGSILEGAFILSRLEKRPEAVADQLAHYRRYLELLAK